MDARPTAKWWGLAHRRPILVEHVWFFRRYIYSAGAYAHKTRYSLQQTTLLMHVHMRRTCNNLLSHVLLFAVAWFFIPLEVQCSASSSNARTFACLACGRSRRCGRLSPRYQKLSVSNRVQSVGRPGGHHIRVNFECTQVHAFGWKDIRTHFEPTVFFI